MIAMLWSIRFLQEALQPETSSVPAIITAACGGVAVILGGIGTLLLHRQKTAAEATASAAEATRDRIGEPNGQRDLVTMIANTQRMMATHEEDFADFRREVNARFDGMHSAIVTERQRADAAEARLDQLEDGR